MFMLPLSRQVISAVCLLTVATLLLGNVHARGETAKSHSLMPCGQACARLPHAGCQSSCAKRPVGRPMGRPVGCPDDYCPKCPPRLCQPKYCGSCDCYRAKCAPCVCLPKVCGARDCYDAKCPPCLQVPCYWSYFTLNAME